MSSLCWREVLPLASSFLWFIVSFHPQGHSWSKRTTLERPITPVSPPARKTDGDMAKGRCLPLLKEGSRSSYTALSLTSHPHVATPGCPFCWPVPNTTGEVENMLGTAHHAAACVISGLPGNAVGLLFLSTSPLYSADPKISPQHQDFNQDQVDFLVL